MKTLTKPEKPKKQITAHKTITFPFDWTSKKVAMGYFLAWVKDNTPAGAKDVTLELQEDWDYYDSSVITSLEIAWNEVIVNPDYDKELKKYEKKLNKWKKENE